MFKPISGQGSQPHGHGLKRGRESRAPAGLLTLGSTLELEQLGLPRRS